MEMQTSWQRTVTEVYGVPSHTICAPEGYELTGEFRPPRQNEAWLASCQKDVGIGLCCDCRLILRPKPKMRTVSFEVPVHETVVAHVTDSNQLNCQTYLWLCQDNDLTVYPDSTRRPLRRLDVK